MAKRRKRNASMGKQSAETHSVSEKAQLTLHLLAGPEKKISKEVELDKDVIELLSGSKIDLKKRADELRRFLAQAKQKYAPTFPKDYYQEINRLKGWSKPEDKVYQKPPIVARYTNEIIYRRFPKDILPALQHLNPYIIFGLRKFKHFQWLNEDGKQLLETYIDQAVELMKKCTSWYQFRVKYAQMYGVTFQLSVLEDNESLFE
ncbi:P63C domain-containing protein [Dyadobacter sp. LJ53]|uniref:P63C domain-containing protein n=1 Tax=Dyadobacter chenwenxiniae TaxID=2906456 RepID=UPI001F2BF78E|nr:P63C domain-containing protein [Dyadobacter chenwenxiniae]MCF0052089.1 P63C domain-containing protein [Dyadobacter chenwenxiniae]